jgi:hypothetical protein
MQESHRKGVAIHPDPESCVVAREGAIEALTGAHAGRVLSCETIAIGVPTLFSKAEGYTRTGATASRHATAGELLRPEASSRAGLRKSVKTAAICAVQLLALSRIQSRAWNLPSTRITQLTGDLAEAT